MTSSRGVKKPPVLTGGCVTIYQKDSGQVKQWGRREGRISELGELMVNLSGRYRDVRLHNINFTDQLWIKKMEELGFDHFCDQFEMKMDC